ncbi:MAG TPA: SAM-dependent methyltransferase [Dinghuibacter sp.]|jgi:SAM-dependent MidA family methyltransferase|uniref:class I SAM-dependent methyltransferase n=1 Tax=Dinghuibacter sp. TaxID=2024697 RepID=UPI002B6726E8|nr:SAM-dependent methyltransferase [Dinghuibacter sp.]HTJ14243.1 SAM-dependent methyltransferase [Dinghuibacter sp.]
MTLANIIAGRIRGQGPIRFKDFMEMALYHPELGYYMSPNQPLGADGDYYTSPYLTPAVGYVIGRQLEQMWKQLGKKPFTVVEYGAGTGMLCRDILEYIRTNPAFHNDLTYVIIEKSPVMRTRERALLGAGVEYADDIKSLGPVEGCVFSNELLDNLSVHLVETASGLQEVWVDVDSAGNFIECRQKAEPALYDYFEESKVALPEGYRTEINLEAKSWLNDVAGALKRGWLMTIDYGYTATEYFSPGRIRGTLMCYHRHTVSEDPYQKVGEQDITAHVNFTDIHRWGRRLGLETEGLLPQPCFLLGLGMGEYLDRGSVPPRVKHALLLGMGARFKVLIQKKGLPGKRLPLLREPLVARNMLECS